MVIPSYLYTYLYFFIKRIYVILNINYKHRESYISIYTHVQRKILLLYMTHVSVNKMRLELSITRKCEQE